MGLLDILGSGTPQGNALGQGLLGMGAGLLSGGAYGALGPSLGKGLLGFQQGEQNALQNQMQQQYLGSRSAMLQQQLSLAKQRQAAVMGLLGIGPAAAGGAQMGASSAPAGGLLGSAGASSYPVSTPSGIPAGASNIGNATGVPASLRTPVAADLLFNGGKGVSGLLKPNVQFENGIAVDMNAVKPGSTVPIISRNGMAVQPVVNADGSISIKAAPGSVDAYRQFQDAQQGAQASHDLVQVTDEHGNKRYVSKQDILNSSQSGAPPLASRSPADVKYDEDVAQSAAKTYNSIQSAGTAAPTKIAEYQQLGNLLANTDLSKTGYEIANFAAKNGLLPSGAADSLGNAQAATALSNRLALTLRSTAEGGGMPGSMSDSDRQFLTQQVPQLETTPQGRHQMIGMLVSVEKRNQQVAQMARDWRKGGGRLDRPDVNGKTFFDYLQAWSNANPLFAKLKP